MSKITSLCWVGLLITFFLLGGCFSSDKKGTEKGTEQVRGERSSIEGEKSNIGKVQEHTKIVGDSEPVNLTQEQSINQEALNLGEGVEIQSTLTPKQLISSEAESNKNTAPLPPDLKPSEVENAEKSIEGGEVGGEQVSSRIVAETQQEGAMQSEESNQVGFSSEFSKVKAGMSYSEVVEVLGEPDMLVSAQKENDTYIYLWKKKGLFFYGKFVKGVLSRHSGKFEEAMEAPPLTEELYHQVNLGMSIDEVNLLLKREGRKISGEGDGEGIFLWSDNKSGTSFSARFDGGKLVRKSSFYSKPKVVGEVATKEKESVVQPEVEELSKDESPLENMPSSTKEKVETTEELTQSPDELVPESNLIHHQSSESENMETKSNVQSFPNPQRIVSVGKRTQIEGQKITTDQSVKETGRKVKLPTFTYQLREGSYEIKIHNPLDVEVTVGIRSEKRGKNFTIEPGGVRSVKVPRGEYQIYYIRSDEPSRVIDGGSVNIDGLFVGDVDIHLIR